MLEAELVHAMAHRMREKLEENRVKGTWHNDDPYWLLMRLEQEVAELRYAVFHGSGPGMVWAEAADVGNLAAMVADTYGTQLLRRG